MTDSSSLPNFTEFDAPDRLRLEEAMSNRFTQTALQKHKEEGIMLAVRARWVALAVIAVLLIFLNPAWEMLYYYVFLALSAFLGWLQTRVGRVGVSRQELAVLFCDVTVFIVALTVPNPFGDLNWPLAMYLRFENFSFVYVILALGTLSYSWRTVIAIGNWTTLLFFISIVTQWWIATPDPALTQAVADAVQDPEMAAMLNPNGFLFDVRIQNAVVFIIVTYTLALSIRRFNRLLLNNAALERERVNLSRYFSPNVVEQLSHNDDPLKEIREHDVAVIFVDIKGFTRFAAGRAPEEVIRTLRSFHARMEDCVFAHNGTLDKFLGDGLMASFGTPFPASDDVYRAYLCSRAMVAAAGQWNAARVAAGEPKLAISVGLHMGPVVLGDIGGNRLEYAVIGNTVNVASRIEGLSRKLDVPLVISDDVVDTLPPSEIPDLRKHDHQHVPGIDQAITVWALPEDHARASEDQPPSQG